MSLQPFDKDWIRTFGNSGRTNGRNFNAARLRFWSISDQDLSEPCFSASSLWYAFQPRHHPVCQRQIRAKRESGFRSTYFLNQQLAHLDFIMFSLALNGSNGQFIPFYLTDVRQVIIFSSGFRSRKGVRQIRQWGRQYSWEIGTEQPTNKSIT